MKKLVLIACAALLTAFSVFAGGRSYEDGFRAGWDQYCQSHHCFPGYDGRQQQSGSTYEAGFSDGVESAARACVERNSEGE